MFRETIVYCKVYMLFKARLGTQLNDLFNDSNILSQLEIKIRLV